MQRFFQHEGAATGAHPDDLEIGMGGTIARYTARGHEVLMVVATVPNRKESRVPEAEEATAILGANLVVIRRPQRLRLLAPARPASTRSSTASRRRRLHPLEQRLAPGPRRRHERRDRDHAQTTTVYINEQDDPGRDRAEPVPRPVLRRHVGLHRAEARSIMVHRTVDTYGPWWNGDQGTRHVPRVQRSTWSTPRSSEVIKDIATW